MNVVVDSYDVDKNLVLYAVYIGDSCVGRYVSLAEASDAFQAIIKTYANNKSLSDQKMQEMLDHSVRELKAAWEKLDSGDYDVEGIPPTQETPTQGMKFS